MSGNTDKWYLSGPLGIDVPEPPQQLSLTGGIGFANHNAKDKKLYSPADGVLEWMTHDWAGQHGFAVSHQGTQRVFLNTNGDSYLNGGKVGIGTTEPKATLHINGELRIDGARTIINGFDGANNHWIKTNTAEPASVFMTFVNTSGGDAQAVRIAPGNKGGLTVNSVGNVGIGTMEPKAKLEIVGAGGGSVDLVVNGRLRSDNNDGGLWVASDCFVGGHSTNKIGFWNGNAWQLTVQNNGYVGIGTMEPKAPLHVPGGGILNGLAIGVDPPPVPGVGDINFPYAYETVGTIHPSHNLRLHSNQWIVFHTGNSQNPTANIDNSGIMAITGSYITAAGAGGEQAYIGGDGDSNDVQLGSLNSGVTSVALWNWTSGTWMSISARDFIRKSDFRYKKNIENISCALDKIIQLRGVTYNWDPSDAQCQDMQNGREIGLIAQEVEKVIPEVISRDGRGVYGISYASLMPLLIEAIKELKEQIDLLNLD